MEKSAMYTSKSKKKSDSENTMSKAICEETNGLVEKCSKFGLFFMRYLLGPAIFSPRVGSSFFIYFTTDAGYDAFALPARMW